MDILTGTLDGLPLSEWTEDDRNDLLNALTGVDYNAVLIRSV
jgi:hypothetical protein